MSYFKKLFLQFLPFLILVFSHAAQAKEYSIPELNIEVQINEDGTITITEHRTYIFDGSYSWANYKLPKSGYSAIRSIQVSEGGVSFTNLNSEEPGTFQVEESDEDFNIKWYYNAEDEERIFTLTYTLEGAVVVGPEWSEFFWIYTAANREKSTENLKILVQLPASVSTSDLHSWIREPAWQIQTDLLEHGFRFSGEDISRKQAVSIRTVFPTSIFERSSVHISDPDFSLQQAEQEEAVIIEQRRIRAQEEAKNKALAWEIIPIISAFSIIIFVFFYRKYGSRHKITLSTYESIMLPGREKPAVIGWLLNNNIVTPGLLMATLLDLARRGYFTIKENESEEKGWLSSNENYYTVHSTDKQTENDLSEFERNLHSFVNQRIQDEGNKLEEIFQFSKSSVSKWYSKWKTELKNHCKEKEWMDPESYKGMYANLGAQFFMEGLAIAGIFIIHPIMALALIPTTICMILSFAIIRRTPKGEELYQKWNNYRKAFKNAKDHSVSGDLIGLHFIYAVAFGVNKNHIKVLFETNPDAVGAIYWIIILPGMHTSPADIATSFSNLAATGTATASGGSIGGGASAGAAGGGASGGAG